MPDTMLPTKPYHQDATILTLPLQDYYPETTIFSFNAIFNQFTHLFCIAHIITDNEKNKLHATIHKQYAKKYLTIN